MAQLMPLSLTVSCSNLDCFYLPGFTFLVLAHPGSPGQNPRVVVVVVVVVIIVVVRCNWKMAVIEVMLVVVSWSCCALR